MDKPKEARTPKKTTHPDRIIGLVGYLLILLPAALGVLYVRAFGVSVVERDAWSMVPLFDRWSSGTLQVSDFFVQHHEHRSTFPEIAELLLGILTKYDNVAEMYLIQICLLITLVVLLLAFRANIRSSLGLFLFVPVSLLVFSFRQSANMLFGYQINFAFVVTFSVLTFFLLYVLGRGRFEKLTFVAALMSATIASYSVLQGLLVWPVGLFQLLIGPLEKARKRVFIVLWGLVGLGEWIAYFVGWSPHRDPTSFIDWYQDTKPGPRSSDPSFLYVLEHPLAGIDFFLNLLANSLFWPQQRSFTSGLFGLSLGHVGGFVLVCLALVGLLLVYKDRRLGERSFWVSLMLYSFLILAAITAGRSGRGVELALAQRYTTFAVIAVVSIYGLLATTALQRRFSIRRPSIGAISLVFLAGAVVLSAATISYPKGIAAGQNSKATTERTAFVLATYESQPDEVLAEVSGIKPDRVSAEVVKERAPVLQRLGYNVFAEPQARGLLPPPPSELSPVASPIPFDLTVSGDGVSQENRSVTVPEGTSFIELEGWAVDTGSESTAGGVYVDIDGKLFPAFYGTARQDVVRSFGTRAYKYSGFERAIPVSEIGAGSHELSIVVLTADRKGYHRPDQKAALEIG